MSLVQKMVSLILYAGHAGKQVAQCSVLILLYNIIYTQVFQRLRLNVCMSHQVTSGLVDALGRDHDAKALQWRKKLLAELKTKREV